MPTTIVTSPNGFPVDTGGREITPARLRRALQVNILVGAMGSIWYTTFIPGNPIASIFLKNDLKVSAAALAWMVALVQFAAVFHLVSMFVYSRTRKRKTAWAIGGVVHRLMGFVLAGVAFWVARTPGGLGEIDLLTKIVGGALVVSWLATNSTGAVWWAWMADLVPEGIRATFFGWRNTVIRLLTMGWVLAATGALDYLHIVNIFYVYSAVFAVGAALGVLDILIHSTLPEPRLQGDVPRIGWAEFTEPVRNWNFLAFTLAMGVWNFANSVLGPFLWPYITASPADGGIGAKEIWVGINLTIVQVTNIMIGTAWGLVMDRFGRRPVVVLGAMHPLFVLVGCFFMTPGNFPILIILTGLTTGILGPAFFDGSGQLMLTLTPQRNRNAYLAWHMALSGVVAAGGSLLGGHLFEIYKDYHHELWAGFVLSSFHIVAAVALVLSIVSVAMLVGIREGRVKPMGYVVSRLLTPNIFRTFMNIGVISGAASSGRTAQALRNMDSESDHLAVADIVSRLHDPDPGVREEAARALGRLGSADALDALVDRLRDPASTIRPEAAWALGRIGDARAVPVLIEGLSCPASEVQGACARALDAIRKPQPRPRRTGRHLRDLLAPADLSVAALIVRLDDPDADLRAEAARALGRLGSHEAVGALVRHLRDPASTIRSEAAQALGQIGDPRAAPALIECLTCPSEEVQDASARALGDIGGRQSIRHLLRLLEGRQPERLAASGAEAVSRLGVIEAAWEIFPHMHNTRNPVLRAQLAIAMGNVLGRPGEFYRYLAGDKVRGGARLGRLCRQARRGLKAFGRSWPRRSHQRVRLGALDEELRRVRGLMEGHSFRPAIEGLASIIRQMALVAIDRDCSDDLALEYAFACDVRLGLGYWFAREVRQRVAITDDPDLLQTDALLALYFLSAYRFPAERAPFCVR
jgi:HEAT repeat protein